MAGDRRGDTDKDRDINAVTVTGRVTQPPEERTTATGKLLSKLRLKIWSGGAAIFIDVTAWEEVALAIRDLDISAQDRVSVEGRLNFEEWNDKKDGSKRSKISITAHQVAVLATADQAAKRQSSLSHAGAAAQGYLDKVKGGVTF